jgi:hypothetical protein
MTLKRIRVYAPVIAITLWSVWIIDVSGAGVVDRLGKLKGTDFVQFYIGGSFLREGRADLLYDARAQYERAQALAPGSPDILYVPIQSPQTALAFAPLAKYRYTVALTVWFTVIVVLYGVSCWILWRDCLPLRGYRVYTVACCAAFPGLYSTVLHGQTSCVGLLALAVALFALRRERHFSAGLALGCLVFKPHWVAVAGAVFVAAREWRVVTGIVASAAAQLGVVGLIVGPAVMSAYWERLRSIQRISRLLEPRPGNTLNGLLTAVIPWEAAALGLYAAAAIFMLMMAARVWRSGARFELRASAIVLAMILISPHAFEYDLILLTPVFILLASLMADSSDRLPARLLSFALPVLFVAPLVTGIPAVLRLQFSVTAMAVILIALAQSRAGTLQTVAGARIVSVGRGPW